MFRNIGKSYWIGGLDIFRRCTGKGVIRYAGEKEILNVEIIGFDKKYCYEGEINGVNLPDGFGKLTVITGLILKGEFHNGTINDFFTLNSDGTEYDGFLGEGKFTGPGIFFRPGKVLLLSQGENIKFSLSCHDIPGGNIKFS